MITSLDEDVACDLLAVYTDENPERFFATSDPDACYKIFQTYKVINWCEYDGESIPVIVSRDWDAHNGDDCDDDHGGDMNPFVALLIVALPMFCSLSWTTHGVSEAR